MCACGLTPARRPFSRAEWIEEHASVGAPLANFAPNHLETYRDPQVPPPLPPGPGAAKSKSLTLRSFTSAALDAVQERYILIYDGSVYVDPRPTTSSSLETKRKSLTRHKTPLMYTLNLLLSNEPYIPVNLNLQQ